MCDGSAETPATGDVWNSQINGISLQLFVSPFDSSKAKEVWSVANDRASGRSYWT
jgi:hypothetical protein